MKFHIAAANQTGFQHFHHNVVILCHRKHRSHPAGIFYGDNPLLYSFTLVLIEISTIIVISRAIRLLLKPLRQPKIVSEILGGIVIGPSVLGLSDKFRGQLFPENASYVLKQIGIIAFMYYLFVSGVKMDLGVMRKSGRKQWGIALFGVFVPIILDTLVSIVLGKTVDSKLMSVPFMATVAPLAAITSFPVLHPILKELNLLSSEMGRLALSAAIIGNSIGIVATVIFEAVYQDDASGASIFGKLVAGLGLLLGTIMGIRQGMLWIVRQTPPGKPVEQMYVVMILASVMVMGFLTDMFGFAIGNGAFWLGLVVPDGPPLGSTIVERSESFIMEILMPSAFAFAGMYTNIYTINDWHVQMPFLILSVVGYIAKPVSTFMAALYFEIPLRDSVALSLIMNLRGQVEILLFMRWMDKGIMGPPTFAMMVLLTVVVTSITTPVLSIVYDPTRPYMVNKRRTIQHTPPNTPVHLVACIRDQGSVAGIISLLEASNPTLSSPFVLHALQLVELVGRASPVFIDHQEQQGVFVNSTCSAIYNALKIYERTREEIVNVQLFTTVSPNQSMYQDICKLALVQKTTLIILPFNNRSLEPTGTELVQVGFTHVNSDVLDHAPCSVGVLVEKGLSQNRRVATSESAYWESIQHIAVLFLGGADAREALSLAERMAGNPQVTLTVIRFLAQGGEGDVEIEKKLDDGLVTAFWVKNEGNDRVAYREVVVRNGEETVAAVQAMNDRAINLWIVGRQQGTNPTLLQGLQDWSENQELGVIGDYVASMDFGGTASVLVMQQQVLRGQGTMSSVVSIRRHPYCSC